MTNLLVPLVTRTHTQLLLTNQVQTQIYNIDDNKILVSATNHNQAMEVKDFALEQPETAHVTLDSQKYEKPKPAPAKKKTDKKKKKKAKITAEA